MTVCPLCGGRRMAGRGRVHDSGECLQPWRLRRRAQHPRAPGQRLSDERKREIRRAADWDLPPELIERIMQRRAREQRYERAMAQAVVVVHGETHNIDGL